MKVQKKGLKSKVDCEEKANLKLCIFGYKYAIKLSLSAKFGRANWWGFLSVLLLTGVVFRFKILELNAGPLPREKQDKVANEAKN